MATFLCLAVLSVIGGSVCLPSFRSMSDDAAPNDPFFGYRRDQFTGKAANENKRGGNEGSNFVDALSKTILTSSVYTEDRIILTITTVASVDVFWDYFVSDGVLHFEQYLTIGETRLNGSMKISSFVYNDNTMYGLHFYMVSQDFIGYFTIDSQYARSAKIERLTGFIDNFVGPLNVRLTGNILEYFINQTPPGADTRNDIETMIGSFGKDGVSPSMRSIDNQRIQQISSGICHATCNLGSSNVGEHVFVILRGYENNPITGSLIDYRSTRFYKLIAIERELPSAVEDYLQFVIYMRHTRLYPDFPYGSLMCSAVGQPTPQINIYKDGVLQNFITKSYFGAFTYALIPFEGHSIDEVTGNYTCYATSGSKTIDEEFFVEEVQHQENQTGDRY